jgi:hypothetical protein
MSAFGGKAELFHRRRQKVLHGLRLQTFLYRSAGTDTNCTTAYSTQASHGQSSEQRLK